MAERENLPAKAPPTSVSLGPSSSLDLSWLPDEERAKLLSDHAKGLLDLHKRAQELHIDVGALNATLGTMTQTTREVADDENAITISHTQTTSVGRTEIMMGNTDKARSGKLSKSQTGEKDWTPAYIIGGIIALVLIAAAFAG